MATSIRPDTVFKPMVTRILPLFALTFTASVASAISPSLLGLALTYEDTPSFPSSSVPVAEPGRLFIKIRPGQSAAVQSALKTIGATITASFPQIGWSSVTFPTTTTVSSAQSKLSRFASFSSVEPMYRRYFLETPNDTRIAEQYSIPRMQLDKAWDVTHGNANVTVCVIDSGFDIGHPDYAGVLLPGKNFGDGAVDDLTDIVGHGTHTSGTVGAATNNGIGIAGNAYGAKILPYKVATAAGGVSGDGFINAIIAAGDAKAPICSVSIGGPGAETIEQDAINYSTAKGTLFIVAAGNDGANLKEYPAAFSACIAVGASDKNDVRASFSNFGADWVDVAAPGVDVLSLYPRALVASGYKLDSGTSMATPNVAGVAALVLSAAGGNGSLSRSELRSYIEDNTDNIGTWISKGRVNAFKAVSAIGMTETDLPSAPVLVQGSLSGGTAANVKDQDGVGAIITSATVPGTGLVGSAKTSFTLTTLAPAKVVRGTLTMSVQADYLTTLQVYGVSSTGKTTLLQSFTGTGASQNLTMQMTKSQIVGALNGSTVNLMIRAFLPTRLSKNASGLTTIDRIGASFVGKA